LKNRRMHFLSARNSTHQQGHFKSDCARLHIKSGAGSIWINGWYSLRITESPLEVEYQKSWEVKDVQSYRRNILLMKRSLFTGFLFFPFGVSVHIYRVVSDYCSVRIRCLTSFTFSRTCNGKSIRTIVRMKVEGPAMLLCLSNAFTRARSFLLFRSDIKTWAWFRTACCSTDNGPWEISCSSSWRSWASSSSDFGTCTYWLDNQY